MPLEGEPTIFINTMELHAAQWYHWLDEGAGGKNPNSFDSRQRGPQLKIKILQTCVS